MSCAGPGRQGDACTVLGDVGAPSPGRVLLRWARLASGSAWSWWRWPSWRGWLVRAGSGMAWCGKAGAGRGGEAEMGEVGGGDRAGQ